MDDITDTIQSIDESLTDGLLVRYRSDPVALDAEAADISAEALSINARLHKGILDYVFHRLYLEAEEPNLELANFHYNLFNRHIYSNPNDMTADNLQVVIPQKASSVRR